MIDSVIYDPIGFILRQYGSQKSYSVDVIRANSTSFSRPVWNRYHRTPQQIAELKKKNLVVNVVDSGVTCILITLQMEHGTLKPGVKTSKKPLIQPYIESNNVKSIPSTHKKQ